MSINAKVKTNQGYAEYWSVIGLPTYDRVKRYATVNIAGYRSEEDRLEGFEPLQVLNYTIKNEVERREQRVPLTLASARNMPEYSEHTLEVKKVKGELVEEKVYKISDEEVEEAIKDITVISGYYNEELPYFDNFENIFKEDGWQAAAYNFIKIYPEAIKTFAAGVEA